MDSSFVGDRAIALSFCENEASHTVSRVRAVVDALLTQALPEVEDIVPSAGRVTVAIAPMMSRDMQALREKVLAVASEAAVQNAPTAATHEIEVSYNGSDIDDVCRYHRISREYLISLHADADYLVESIGFLPGFGYLKGLPKKLWTPRRANPRTHVPAGAVGIGGGHTGVYPFESPGGWNLIGHSAVKLFDVRRSKPSTFEVGDHVRFTEVHEIDQKKPVPTPSNPRPAVTGTITVVQPGLFTTVQDLGRHGYRREGVPLSGAADHVSMRLANLFVGNPVDAAVLECTVLGPTLRFEHDAAIVVVGAEFPGLPHGQVVHVSAGTQVTMGHSKTGCRGYLAIAGGIDVPVVLSSRSTLAVAGLGGFHGRALKAGDCLSTLPPSRRHRLIGRVPETLMTSKAPRVLRVIPHADTACDISGIWNQVFHGSSRSNRMGLRLEGKPVLCNEEEGLLPSTAVFPGTIQLPPDGNPIILLADAQTTGGYPVVGTVIHADVPLAAQVRPGDEIRLEPTTIDEAYEALQHCEDLFQNLRRGLS